MRRPKPSNSTIAGGIRTTVPLAASWRVFDRLPRRIREILWTAPMPINPIDVGTLLAMADIDETVEALRQAIAREMALFAAEHRARHGHALPHQAAGATLQGYGR